MPELDAYLHYRLIDVSSVKELVRRWYPRVYFSSPPKRGNHRALADVRESIEELRYYRDGRDGARDRADQRRGPAHRREPRRRPLRHAGPDRSRAPGLTRRA